MEPSHQLIYSGRPIPAWLRIDLMKITSRGVLPKVKVAQYSGDGKFIKEYESIKSASIAANVRSSNIVNVLKGRGKTAGGFLWRKV